MASCRGTLPWHPRVVPSRISEQKPVFCQILIRFLAGNPSAPASISRTLSRAICGTRRTALHPLASLSLAIPRRRRCWRRSSRPSIAALQQGCAHLRGQVPDVCVGGGGQSGRGSPCRNHSARAEGRLTKPDRTGNRHKAAHPPRIEGFHKDNGATQRPCSEVAVRPSTTMSSRLLYH